MATSAVTEFLASFMAHLRYGEKPTKGQLSACRTLAAAALRQLDQLPAEPVVKTRRRAPARKG